MFELYDEGKITGEIGFICGTYFKNREPVVFNMLADGLTARGGWIKGFENHSKLIIMRNDDKQAYYSVESSANLTANPRLEQFAVTNDKGLYEFHRDWMREMRALTRRTPWC